MELGNLNNRAHMQTGIASAPIRTPQEKVKVQLDSTCTRWNYSTQELDAIKQCFIKMWITKEAKNYPDALAQKQLSLLKDMDKYPDLRVACFDLMPLNSSGCDENVFPLFLELQDKVGEIITNNPTLSTLFELPKNKNHKLSPDSYRALKNSLRTEFNWQGKTYNKNSPSPEELAPNYKSEPYISITGVPLRHLNDEVCFLPQKNGDLTTKKIVCRHFAIQLIKDTLEDKSGKGKVNLIPYFSEKSIAQHIPIAIEAACTTLINNAKSYQLIDNDKLGQHLCQCFGEMRKPENQETIRVLLIESTFHSMVLRIRIKGTKEDPIFVVTFYDPNKTTVAVRCETNELRTFTNYSLKQFINGSDSTEPGSYEAYYDGMEPISLLMDCNLASFTENLTKKTKVLENFAPSKLTSTSIFFLLSGNFAHDLAGLRAQLEKIVKNSTERLFNLLATKAANGTPGLNIALQEGYADVIKAYGESCQLFPKNARGRLVDLLAAKKADGTPGLFMALQNGRTEAVKAYGKLVQLLPETQGGRLVDLLAAKTAKGLPGLFIALQNGHADVVKEYGHLLQLFPKTEYEKLVDVLAAKKADGTPGLYIALQNGHADVVKEYGHLLQLLPKTDYEKLVDVLAAKKANGLPGLFMALHNGHADAVKAYVKLLQLFPEIESRRLIDLLAATDSDGVPGLFMALSNGHADVIKIYGELLQQLPEKERNQLLDLLEAPSAYSWLYQQLKNGNKEVIGDHKRLLQLVSTWRAEFVTKK